MEPLVIEMLQRTNDWHDWRGAKGRFALDDGGPRMTATMLCAIMGVSPYQTKRGLWQEMTGRIPPKKENWAMKRGKQFEDEARNAYNKQFGFSMVEACIQHAEHPWAGASLDGIDALAGRLSEIKIPGQEDIALVRDLKQVPPKYIPQVQWQLFCAGDIVEANDFWVYDPTTKTGHCVTVPHDKELQKKLFEEARTFRECLIQGLPPFEAGLNAKAAIWLACTAEMTVLEQRIEVARQALIEELVQSGKTKIEANGVSVSESVRKGKPEIGLFIEKLAEITGSKADDLLKLKKSFEETHVDPFINDMSSRTGMSVEELTNLQDSMREPSKTTYIFKASKDADKVLDDLRNSSNTTLTLKDVINAVDVTTSANAEAKDELVLSF